MSHINDHQKYSMSFTTGGLFHQESVLLASVFIQLEDWDMVRKSVVAENLLQARTANTLKRVCREIISRLKTFDVEALEFLVTASPQEQRYLLWIAVCRRYSFIGDFAVDVLHEKYITLKKDLLYEDYDSFYHRKSEWHAELETISRATRGKTRQIIFKMLREADLLTDNYSIKTALLSPGLLSVINGKDVLFFPVFESDVRGMTK